MAGCPSKECHDNLTEVRSAVFDHTHGLRSKVSKIAVWLALTVIGIPLLGTGFATGIKVWFGNETATMRFADQQMVSTLKERVNGHDIQYKFLCESLLDMKKTLDEVRLDVKALGKP